MGYQVSEKLQNISEAAITNDGEEEVNPDLTGTEKALAEENLKAGAKMEKKVEQNLQNDTVAHASVPVAALIAAALAPSLPRRNSHRHTAKAEWSSFFPHAGIAARQVGCPLCS